MPDLIVQAIEREQLALAYPLVRSATQVSLERWEEFGRELVSDDGGVLAVMSPDSCVHGVATYRPARNLRREHSLDVDVIVAFDLQGGDRVRSALCAELERIASTLGCSAVNFVVAAKSAEPASRARSGLERLGLKFETASFVRELPEES